MDIFVSEEGGDKLWVLGDVCQCPEVDLGVIGG